MSEVDKAQPSDLEGETGAATVEADHVAASEREPAAAAPAPDETQVDDVQPEPVTEGVLADPFVAPPSAARAAGPTRRWRDYSHAYVLVGLLAVTVIVRLSTLPMIEMGGDAVKAWFNAKQLTLGIAGRYWEWDHHAVRFAIIVPTALIQLVFGLRPHVYYMFPIGMALLQVGLLYAIGRRIGHPIAGFCAALAMVLHPQLERTAGQILSEVPSAVAALLGVWVLLRYRDEPQRRLAWAVALALVMFFLGWMTKLTNVLFVPGFALALYVFGRRWRDVFIFGGVLLALFLVETLVYRSVLNFPLGQLSVVKKTHLSHRALKPVQVSDFFTHVLKLVPVWKVTLVAFAVACLVAVAAKRKLGKDPAVIALVPASFLLLQNFAVKSIHPLVPVQRFLSRYLEPALPLMLLVVFWVCALAVRELAAHRRWKVPALPVWPRAALVCVVLLGVAGWALGSRYPAKGKHPFELLTSYEHKANPAFANGVPVVSLEKNDKDVDFFLKVLWDGMRSRTKLLDMPKIRTALAGKKKVYFVIHPKHQPEYKGTRDSQILEKWVNKEVVLVGRHAHPGKNMGFVFDLKMGKLKAK